MADFLRHEMKVILFIHTVCYKEYIVLVHSIIVILLGVNMGTLSLWPHYLNSADWLCSSQELGHKPETTSKEHHVSKTLCSDFSRCHLIFTFINLRLYLC